MHTETARPGTLEGSRRKPLHQRVAISVWESYQELIDFLQFLAVAFICFVGIALMTLGGYWSYAKADEISAGITGSMFVAGLTLLVGGYLLRKKIWARL